MMIEPDDALLPCPFCGGEPYIGGDEAQLWFAGCCDCHCMVGEGYDRDAMPDNMLRSKEEAIAAWNSRAGHAARDAEVEALRARVAEVEDVIKHALYTHETSGTIAPSSVKKMRAALKGRTND